MTADAFGTGTTHARTISAPNNVGEFACVQDHSASATQATPAATSLMSRSRRVRRESGEQVRSDAVGSYEPAVPTYPQDHRQRGDVHLLRLRIERQIRDRHSDKAASSPVVGAAEGAYRPDIRSLTASTIL